MAISSKQLQRIAAQLERNGHSEIRLQAEVELFLRVSNSDVLSSIECTDFRVLANANDNAVCAVASSEKDCGQAWERGIEPIKQAALQGMRRDVWNMDAGRRPLDIVAQLQVDSLGGLKGPGHSEIHIAQARSIQNVRPELPSTGLVQHFHL